MIGLLTLTPHISYAQSASESYDKGVALMNKGDYQGAIASFKASMAINKSAANVKKCKAQINKCNRLAKHKSDGAESSTAKSSAKKLTISTYNLTFDANTETTKNVGIETLPESNDWTATLPEEDGKWCKLSKSMDGKELQVTCYPTVSTIYRSTNISVVYGDQTRFIKLFQKGRKPQLYASNALVKMNKRKDVAMKLAVSCNSDTVYADTKNWELVKCPDWCEATATSKEELTIKTNKLDKTSPFFKSGRSGDIIIRSQSEEFIIRVDQR